MKKLLIFTICIFIINSISAQVSSIESNSEVIRFKAIIEPGFGYGIKNVDLEYSVYSKYGFLLKQRYFFGAGFGFKKNDFAIAPIIPFYGNFRLNILKKDKTPFLEIIGGSNYMLEGHGVYGYIVGLGIGYHEKVSDKLSVNIGVSAEFQQIKAASEAYGSYQYVTDRPQVRVFVGILFN